MIELISTSKLYPHPDNPRKNLGDLTELAESIKTNGILQNLTAIKRPGEEDAYTVIIGHRRLAAAQLAGVTEVPCAITEMTEQEQVATMLLENIQRADLTIYEQAQGFQMMMNLGDSVKSIAQRTGFSETTVRKRVKLLELDEKEFKAASERGATLFDFAELDRITDLDLKNKALAAIGTPNFKNEVERAVCIEKNNAKREKWREVLNTFATEVESEKGYALARYLHISQEIIEKPSDADTVQYFYSIDKYDSIRLMKNPEQAGEKQESPEEAQRRARQEYRRANLKEATERAFKCRVDFIQNISAATVKKHFAEIITAIIMKLMMENWIWANTDELCELLEVDLPEDETEWPVIESMLLVATAKKPEKALLLLVYYTLNDSDERGYYRAYDLAHQQNARLDSLYALLNKLGYQMSDEERMLQDGTHEMFKETEE